MTNKSSNVNCILVFQGGESARTVAEAKGGGGRAALQVPGGGGGWEAEEPAGGAGNGEARVTSYGPDGATRPTGTIERWSPRPQLI